MYIYIYGSDQVSAMHPPSSKLLLGKKKTKTKKKKYVIYFVHVCTSKKTF